MTVRHLQKWHGAGNDFLVDVGTPDARSWWDVARVQAVCNRTTGIGADGVMIATPGEPITMTLYNADGSEAEMSGNGIRCFAGAVRRATNTTWNELDVATLAGLRRVSLSMDGLSGWGSVAMGDVSFLADIDGAYGVASVGNPHVVVLDDASWSIAECEEIAAKLAAEVGGANVEFLTVVDDNHLRIRVIERGVGWTQACGTGSCATAAIARRGGLSGDVVNVENPGGVLEVAFDGMAVTLAGPVQFVADVEWLSA